MADLFTAPKQKNHNPAKTKVKFTQTKKAWRSMGLAAKLGLVGV
jgi:hypothetical protein